MGGGEYLRDAEVEFRNHHAQCKHTNRFQCRLCRRCSFGLSSSNALACALQQYQLRVSGVQITWDDLKAAESAVGDFGSDNRAGVQGTLHRISAMRSRKGTIVGLTCRVGRAVTGHVDMIRDILDGDSSGIAV